MNQIAGPTAALVPLRRADQDVQSWAGMAALKLQALLGLDADARRCQQAQGQAWVAQFSSAAALDRYESIYHQVLQHETVKQTARDAQQLVMGERD